MGPNPLLAAGLGQLPHGTAVSNTWPHAQALLPSHAQSAYHAQSASQCPSLCDVQIQTFIAAMQQQQQRQPQLQPQPVHSNILAQIRAFTPQASPLTPMRAMPCGTASCLLLVCWGDPSELTWCATAGAAMVFPPNAAAFAAPNGVQSWSGDSPPFSQFLGIRCCAWLSSVRVSVKADMACRQGHHRHSSLHCSRGLCRQQQAVR